jgi:hypothetical protein
MIEMIDSNKARQEAVRDAWKIERQRVRSGSGTRDWSQKEQRQIIALGRAKGYEGHHMKSVKAYPRYAGDSNNIQFLNRVEHIQGAHRGNTKNPTNGYYDPLTKQMKGFGNHKPTPVAAHRLSSPLTKARQVSATKSGQIRNRSIAQAKRVTGRTRTSQINPKYRTYSNNAANHSALSNKTPGGSAAKLSTGKATASRSATASSSGKSISRGRRS